ncbi:MAG: helix-turn-helix domain-containing protein [Pseudomonadota bacterium]
MDKLEAILSCRVLRQGLPQDALSALAAAASWRRFKNNENIYQQNEKSDGLFVIPEHQQGGVLIRDVSDDIGREIDIERLWAGDIFGEIELLESPGMRKPPRRRYSAQALGEIDTLFISYTELINLNSACPALVETLTRRTVERIHHLCDRLGEAQLGSLDIKLARLLCDLSAGAGIPEGRGFRLIGLANQQNLARHLGTDRTVLSRKLNRWERDDLVQTVKGSLIVKDAQRLRRIATMTRRPSTYDHQAALDEIKQLLDRGENLRVRNYALDYVKFFPGCCQLLYSAALANARAGAVEEALDILGASDLLEPIDLSQLHLRVCGGFVNPFRKWSGRETNVEDYSGNDEWSEQLENQDIAVAARHLTEDILALGARIYKDLGFASEDKSSRYDFFNKSIDAYRRADSVLGNGYAKINIAALALMIDDQTLSREYAEKALNAVGQSESFWALATQAEAHLLLENDDAPSLYAQAYSAPDATPATIASARQQLQKLTQVAPKRAQACMDAMPGALVAVYSGHMVPKSLDEEDRASGEDEIINQLNTLTSNKAYQDAYGSLACGADIIFAEQFLASGARLHVSLPMEPEAFVKVSVASRSDPDLWSTRFHACMAQASSITVVQRQAPRKRDFDEAFYATAAHAAGMALLREDELSGTSTLFTVTDLSASGGIGSANFLQNKWRTQGRPVAEIACPWKRNPPTQSTTTREPKHQAAAVFIWAVANGEKQSRRSKSPEKIAALSETLMDKAKSAAEPGIFLGERILGARSVGVFGLCRSINEALAFAKAMRSLKIDDDVELNIMCEAGVFEAGVAAVDRDISQFPGARDIIDLPSGVVCMSEEFAARLRFESDETPRIRPMGLASVEGPLPSRRFFRVD